MEKKNGAFFLNLPPTEAGGKLKLTKEQQEQFMLVYQKIDGENRAKLLEPFNPDKEYSDDCCVVVGDSVFEDIVMFGYNTLLYNLQRTQDDKHNSGASWIAFLKIVYEVACPGYKWILSSCSVESAKYNMNNGFNACAESFECTIGGCIHGAHVGRIIQNFQPDNRRYIVPLCAHHNSLNNNYYMKTKHREMPGVSIREIIELNDDVMKLMQ